MGGLTYPRGGSFFVDISANDYHTLYSSGDWYV